jgi:DNA-binding XRE family transcriptional regulator
MSENKIKYFRNKKGITEQDLAEKIACTREYIQRIEGGHEAVKIESALAISKALEVSFEDVFPKTRDIIKKSNKEKEPFRYLFENAELRAAMDKAGIDMFRGQRYFTYNLRGGASGTLEITTQEKDRLVENALNRNGSTPFAAFYSGAWCILINLNHLIFGQFLFEWGSSSEIQVEDAQVVEIFFADNAAPKILEVEEDEPDPADLEAPGQIGLIISLAQTMVEQGEFFSIEDVDGELSIFPAHDVAMMKVPLWVFCLDLEPPEVR